MQSLDLLSTSQTNVSQNADFELEQSYILERRNRCENGAPYIFFRDANNAGHLIQGSCNSWTCPRCGNIRAREEYARIVEGAAKLQADEYTLYFWTMTCRGKDMPLKQAEENYLKWTNKLLTAARTKATRADDIWCYVQVTERQKRLHPHSHMITTYCPPDAIPFSKGDTLPNGRKARHDCLWSEWYRAANISAGLGAECDLSLIREPQAVAVYVAKYLFKDAMNTVWPKGWRRVRYSHSWPKLPEPQNTIAYPVLTRADWRRLANENGVILCDTQDTYERCLLMRVFNVRPKSNN